MENKSEKKGIGFFGILGILLMSVFIISVLGGLCDKKDSTTTPVVSTQPVKPVEKKMSDTTTSRTAFAEYMRDNYLDNNLDIKVVVTGKYKQKMTLRYPLFNDVWTHKIKQSDLLDTLVNLGFDYLELNDGYDYAVYWDLKPKDHGYIYK
jgi:hypothetical protein